MFSKAFIVVVVALFSAVSFAAAPKMKTEEAQMVVEAYKAKRKQCNVSDRTVKSVCYRELATMGEFYSSAKLTLANN